jgi:hypothetical protein
VHPVNYIFLVGGFAESKLLLHRVRNGFERDGLRVVVPRRPGLAVLRGAVMLGLGASRRFASRISRWTYGVAVRIQFDASNPEHSARPQHTVMEDGIAVPYVNGKFQAIVERGTCIKEQDQHETKVYCPQNQISVTNRIFASSSSEARWVTDAGMTLLGSIIIPATGGDSIKVQLSFGRTEIRAVAVNERTGDRRPIAIDYDLRAA